MKSCPCRANDVDLQGGQRCSTASHRLQEPGASHGSLGEECPRFRAEYQPGAAGVHHVARRCGESGRRVRSERSDTGGWSVTFSECGETMKEMLKLAREALKAQSNLLPVDEWAEKLARDICQDVDESAPGRTRRGIGSSSSPVGPRLPPLPGALSRHLTRSP